MATSPGAGAHWLNRTVLGAGITSALADLTYETTNVLLPGFLAVLGLPAAVLGTIEGIADGLSSFTKLAAGYISDRLGFRKELVVVGYGLTAAMQVFMALAVGWPLVLIGRVVGWLGRGVRGPLRDAIMAEAITPQTRGRAFGFHRAADTVGAVIGPLLGVLLLGWARHLPFADESAPFRFVFWLTLIPGVLSVLSFAVLVKDDRSGSQSGAALWASLRGLPVGFRRYLGALACSGSATSHTLLILAATELLTPSLGVIGAAQAAGLLYVGRNLVEALAAFPVGFLGDRVGHRPVLVGGYALGVLTSVLVAVAFAFGLDSLVLLGVVFALAGSFMAVQESLEGAMTADLVPTEVRGLSYGVLGTVNGVGDFVSSVAVGFLWTAVSPVAGFGLAALLMAAGTIVLAWQRD